MTLNLGSPTLGRILHHSVPLPRLFSPHSSSTLLSLLLGAHIRDHSGLCMSPGGLIAKASVSGSANGVSDDAVSQHLSDKLLVEVSAAKDANEALEIIAEKSEWSGGIISVPDCCSIIKAALERNNTDLALSVFYAMRASFGQGVAQDGLTVQRWKWSRPDVRVCTLLIQGLAASLRVSDAIKMINGICQVAVSPAEEVPFGNVVNCPVCNIAVAVAQPQDGIQIVSCSQCRYKYELVSGDIINIESEEISMDVAAWRRGLRFLKLTKLGIPGAVHSIVVQTPSGVARTHRFATETVDLPAQAGERVTIAAAAPSNVYKEVGPFKLSPKAPNYYPSQPICLTNHKDGREWLLLRAPSKEGTSLLNPSLLFPLFAVLATGDAASGAVDPSLPQLLSVVVVASVALGTTLNVFVLPQLKKIAQSSADAISIKQKLLSQYALLQSRIKNLREASEKEIWMLARMCQLENKIFAVGEPSYRARKSRVKKVREALEDSLKGRIELIDSYARISSMIEIEVEMDSDVLAAEAVSNVERAAEQIQQIMEIENLEERWKLQAEANDEAERLLSSQNMSAEED